MKTMSVTFDTNTFRKLVEPHKRQGDEENKAFEQIELSIKEGRIQPYISDVIYFLEGVPKHERAEYHSSLYMQTKTTSSETMVQSDGTPVHKTNMTITPTYGHNPTIGQPLKEALQKGLALGFKFLGNSRVGLPRFEQHLYKTEVSTELGPRLDRGVKIINEFNTRGFGAAHIVDLSKIVLANNPEMKSRGEMTAFAHGDKESVPEAIAEWADGDAIAAHYAYAHDFFCTLDQGKGSGPKSALHINHRNWLEQEFRITIVTPVALIQKLEI